MEKGTLLIVEDDILVLEYLQEVLDEYSDEVFTAINGEIAYKFLINNKVDCIISDIRMPEMDGIGLLKKLYKHKII